MVLKVLLDSTYLLPTFGVSVRGLSDEDIETLRILGRTKVRYYCLSVVWVEILGKIHREALKKGISLDGIINAAIESLLSSGFYEWISPSLNAVKIAYELRLRGHRDIIDNLLYGTAISEHMIFLTMDMTFIDFLKRNNYATENVYDHKKLIQIIQEWSSKQ